MPKIAKVGRPMCKYETAYAFSRRRMQYDIGDAPLDTPKEEQKKSLDPEEDKKLSGDMRELYDRLLPSEDSKERRTLLITKLERILRKEFPGNDFNVVVFGSSGNLLCTNDSDGMFQLLVASFLTFKVDICIQTGLKELESMHQLAAALDRSRLLVKFVIVANLRRWHGESDLCPGQSSNRKDLGSRVQVCCRPQREQPTGT
jgi:DNA polymerase sigma